MKKILSISLLLLGTWVFTACSDDKETTSYQHTEQTFKNLVGGDYDPLHWWKTAIQLKVTVKTDFPATVVAYSTNGETGVFYDSKHVSQDSTLYLTLPQITGRVIYLIARNSQNAITQTLNLTGSLEQSVSIDLSRTVSSRSMSRTADITNGEGSTLYGTDITPNIGYTEVNREGIEIVTHYTTEGMNPIDRNLNTNYELISQGPFNITMYYGFTGLYKPRILGYYRHSPGTYEDLEMIDLVDTHSFDYINGQCKLQYQLDGVTDRWYDSNFDYRDGYSEPFTSYTERLNDDAYNIQHVMDQYGERMTKARGLTWEIDTKPGDRVGFYLKMEGSVNNAQRLRAIGMGLPADRLPNPMYETNWSAQLLNTDGKLRSILIKENGYTIMGMEDATSSGDFDCNDVLFGLHADMESEMPLIILPEIDDPSFRNKPMPWTIAFEDLMRQPDFDFNDAVIRLEPDYNKEQCNVTLMAVGSTARMYLHYDGPDGDQNLGELHELMNRKAGTKINTTSSYAPVSFVTLESVKWPKDYDITKDAHRFYIEIKRGTCQDCSDLLTLPMTQGVVPQAMLIAGSWHWPMEGKHINEAYPQFSSWATDMTNSIYWNWYTSPKSGTTVNY